MAANFLPSAATSSAKELRSPFENANYISRILFLWASPLFTKGGKQPLQQSDLWPVTSATQSKLCANRLMEEWQREIDTCKIFNKNVAVGGTSPLKKPSLWNAIFKAYGREYALAVPYKLAWGVFAMANVAFFMREIILFIGGKTDQSNLGDALTKPWVGPVLSAFLFFSGMLQSLCVHQQFFISINVGLQLRAACMQTVFAKALRLSPKAMQNRTIGECVNLMSNDASRMLDAATMSHFIWGSVLESVAVLGLLVREVDYAAVPGFVCILLLFFPAQSWFGKRISAIRRLAIKVTDERVRLISEALTSIQLIKLQNWESSFFAKITGLRAKELSYLVQSATLRCANTILGFAAPVIVSLLVFAVFTATGHQLTASNTFVTLALFNLLRYPLIMLPSGVQAVSEARVAVARLQSFLSADELEQLEGRSLEAPASGAVVRLRNCTFTWESASPPQLQNVNFEVPAGQLHAVIGPVGSSKSSLLAAMIGEMKRVKPEDESDADSEFCVQGKIAYCSQQAWILNATIRENILFGHPFDAQRYQMALSSCALLPDLAMLPSGDETEVGERGITLSGGQKARVALARAVYSDADIMCLDDPLAAVDSHVGRHLFESCISDALKSKTRILVTHQLQFLSRVDRIYVMKEGKIELQGTYEELKASGFNFGSIIHKEHDEEVEEVEAEEAQQKEENDGKEEAKTIEPAAVKVEIAEKKTIAEEEKKKKTAGALMTMEERAIGSVSWTTYSQYMLAAGGFLICSVIIGLFILTQAVRVVSDYWLSYWIAQGSLPVSERLSAAQSDVHYYLYIYIAFSLGVIALSFFRSYSFAVYTLKSSTALHNRVFERILHARMSFFDTTPVGRILNRFSKDLDTVDSLLPTNLEQVLQYGLMVLSSIIVVIAILPWFLIPLLFLVWMFSRLQKLFQACNRELKRLDGISRSPVFSLFSATLQGLSSIRAYGIQSREIKALETAVDENTRAVFAFSVVGRWLGMRIDVLAAAVTLFASLFSTLARDTVSAAIVGFLLSYTYQTSGLMQWAVRVSSETSSNFTCVERVLHYAGDAVPVEAPAIVQGHRPEKSWPSQGVLEFKNVVLKYRENLDPVLKDVSFKTRPNEKIGIVGRSGSGKSTTLLGIFRLMELFSGSIELDGVDIASIGLDDLRSKLSLIAQTPVLFVGTIASNLDPFNVHTEQELLEALERVHVREAVDSMPAGLQASVSENGENLSVGTRQLICLARALLRHSKLILIDEATASVDREKDGLIQQTIRSAFSDCTVITIAHRIETIIDCDRVLVMGEGKMLEFDSPAVLLRDSSSAFSSLIAQTGNLESQRLKSLAFEAESKRADSFSREQPI